MSPRIGTALAAAVCGLLGGCSAIAGLEELTFTGAADTTSASGTGGAGGTGGAVTTSSGGGGDGGGSGGAAGGGGNGGGCTNMALRFNGTDNLVTVPADAVFNGPVLTIEMWVAPGPALGTRELRLLTHGVQSTAGYNFLIYNTGTVHGRIFEPSGVAQADSIPFTLVASTWSHIAFVINSPQSEVSIFIDGIRRDLESVAFAYTPWNGGITFGANDAGTLFWYEGDLDEIRISSVVRYTDDFAVPSEPFVPDASTIALWHFDEGTGATANDTAGDHHGALAGASPPQWVAAPCGWSR